MSILTIWKKIYEKFTAFRKKVIDTTITRFNFSLPHPDYLTVTSLALSFFLFLLIISPRFAFLHSSVLLFFVIIFDALDGAAARLRNVNNPINDVAADRFSELLICSALLSKEYPFSLGILMVAIINVFLPWRFIPILPLRIFLLIYFYFLWRTNCIPFL